VWFIGKTENFSASIATKAFILNNEEDPSILSFFRAGRPRPGSPVSRLELEVTWLQYIAACPGFFVIAELELDLYYVKKWAVFQFRAMPVTFRFQILFAGMVMRIWFGAMKSKVADSGPGSVSDRLAVVFVRSMV